MHWKLDHYAAIVGKVGDGYVVRDSTFRFANIISRDAIMEEASGAFLVPAGLETKGMVAMRKTEAETIFGRGYTDDQDGGETGGCSGASGGSTGSGGGPSSPCPMAVYSVHTMLVSLWVGDRPVGYTPPFGPDVYLEVAYNERATWQPGNLNFSNFGRQWNHNWLSYVSVGIHYGPDPDWEEDVYVTTVKTILRGGGETVAGRSYSLNPPTLIQSFAGHESKSRAKLTITNGNKAVRELRNGWKEIYGRKISVSADEDRYWLTEVMDPHGNSVTVEYDSTFGRIEKIVDANDEETLFYYEDSNDDYKVTKVEDPHGRSAEFAYDSGRLESITDIIGIESSFTYAGGDIIDSLTTPYGTTEFERFGSGLDRAIEITDPLDLKERVEYRRKADELPSSAPEEETPPESVYIGGAWVYLDPEFNLWNSFMNGQMTFFWDKKMMKENPGDYTKALQTNWLIDYWDYVTSGIPGSIKPPLEYRLWIGYPGSDNWYSYSGNGAANLWARRTSDGGTQVWRRGVNSFGLPTSFIDPLGRETKYTYDSTNINLTKVEQRTGESTWDTLFEATYNSENRPTSVTDAAGETTTMTWNARGQLTSITTPLSETTDFTYDTDGFLTEIDGPLTGTSDVVTLTWDDAGRVETVAFDGYEVAYEYDDADRVTKITYPDTTSEEFEYTNLDLTRFRDRMERWTEMEYNANRQLVKVTDPLERETEFDWCRCGDIKLIKDANGNETRWKYDIQGRKTEKIFPDDSKIFYDYTPARGLLEQTTDALGQKKIFSYALDDRLLEIEYADALHPTPNVSLEWDERYPRLAVMEDGIGETTFAYHPAGQPGAGLLAEVDGPLPDDTITYGYDELSRLVEREINGCANKTEWSHDALDRITEIVNALGTFAVTYDGPTRRVATIARSGGMVTAFNYLDDEGDHRLEKITHKKDGTNPWMDFEYDHDPVGNITEWVAKLTGQPDKTREFSYDAADQLTGAVLSESGVTEPLADRTFVYDPAGNRTEADEEPAWYNNLNQLTGAGEPGLTLVSGEVNTPSTVKVDDETVTISPSTEFATEKDWPIGPVEFTVQATNTVNVSATNTYTYDVPPAQVFEYDLNGNMVSDGERTFEWDAEPRCEGSTAVDCVKRNPKGEKPPGRRSSQNRLIAINYDEEGDERTEFEYDGFGRRVRIIELDNETVLSEKWFVWDGMEIVEQRAADGETVEKHYFPEGFQEASNNYYYAKDHLGSIRAVVDASGSERGRWDYDEWGVRGENEIETSPVEPDFSYTGHYHHERSGFVMAPFRAYWPEIGRWLSRDPLGEFADGPNLYSYVLNNPVNLWDPLGWCANDPILNDPNIRKMIDDMWNKSKPTLGFHHEHYGFISENPDGSFKPSPIYKAETRWGGYRGSHQEADPDGTVAGIHTHPLSTRPIKGDRDHQIARDRDRPEYVITRGRIYKISPDGTLSWCPR